LLRKVLLAALACLLPALSIASAGDASIPRKAGYRLLKLEGKTVKWGEPAYGAQATVSYAFIEGDQGFEDARNCQAMGPVDPILAFNSIERAVFEAAAEEAFRTWEAAADVRFVKAASPAEAGILIGIDLGNHGWAHADVKTAPGAGDFDVITRGLVCLSTEKSWKIGFGGDSEAQDIRYTLIHEIGHAIGLNHASPYGQVMSFNYTEDFGDLQSGDIAGARAIYGAPPERTIAGASLILPSGK
jgi:hypothetical protein